MPLRVAPLDSKVFPRCQAGRSAEFLRIREGGNSPRSARRMTGISDRLAQRIREKSRPFAPRNMRLPAAAAIESFVAGGEDGNAMSNDRSGVSCGSASMAWSFRE